MSDRPVINNMKHKEFADRLLADKTKNARKSYQAVYPKTKKKPAVADANASRLLKNAKVRAYIDAVDKEATENVVLSVTWVKEKLKRFSESKITDYYSVDENGILTLKKLDELPGEMIDCIQEIQQTKDGIKIKLVDKKSSVTDIGKSFGMFTENLHVTGLTFAEAIKRRKEELAKGAQSGRNKTL